VGGEEQVLGELLRERAAAAREALLLPVLLRRLLDRLPVEALVVEELGILGCHDGMDQVARDALQRHARLDASELLAALRCLALALAHHARLLRILVHQRAQLARRGQPQPHVRRQATDRQAGEEQRARQQTSHHEPSR
jgi:hypothetical protein